MSYFQKALAAVFAITMSWVMVSPASATALYSGAAATYSGTPSGAFPWLQVGNYLITSVQCAAGGSTVTCTQATWAVDPNSLASATAGDIAITITPNATWAGTGNDLNVTFAIQSLIPGTVVTNGMSIPATFNNIRGIGAGAVSTGTHTVFSAQANASAVGGPLLGSEAAPATLVSSDPSSPSQRISFSPQSVVFVSLDMSPILGGTLTSASLFVQHAPEPATLALLFTGAGLLANFRRRTR